MLNFRKLGSRSILDDGSQSLIGYNVELYVSILRIQRSGSRTSLGVVSGNFFKGTRSIYRIQLRASGQSEVRIKSTRSSRQSDLEFVRQKTVTS